MRKLKRKVFRTLDSIHEDSYIIAGMILLYTVFLVSLFL